MTEMRELADRLGPARDGDAWADAVRDLPRLGLSRAVFLDLRDPAVPIVLSDAGTAWRDTYADALRQGADPFPRHCLSGTVPVMTGVAHLGAHPHLDAPSRDRVARGSGELGIQTGLSITVLPHACGAGIGWNLMSDLAAPAFAELRAWHEAEWRAWCHLVYAALTHGDGTPSRVSLSPRERDCLAYIADGLRTSDIAHRLGIANATVELHMRRARHRLGARTRDHAVAIAVRLGLV